MERFERTTPPNRMCLWYKGGDVAREPYLALIVESCPRQGILELAVIGKRMVAFQCRSGVRHRDDPFLVTRPEHVKENGFWDYLPGMEPVSRDSVRSKDPVSQPEETTPSAPEATDSPENRRRVNALTIDGKSSPEIATIMSEETGEHWTHQRIGAIVRQFANGE